MRCIKRKKKLLKRLNNMAIKKKKVRKTTKQKSRKPVKSVRKTVAQKKVRKKVSGGKKRKIVKPARKTVKKKTVKKIVKKKTAAKGSKPKTKVKAKTKITVKPKVRTTVAKKKTLPKTARPVSKRPAKKRLSLSVRVRPSGQLSRHEILRKLLIQRREEIVREAKTEIAKYIKGEASQLVETALDDGDWSVIDLSADINLRLLESHRERLLKIDESLRKLREGSYGTCEDCGGEISAERLKVLPFAIFCRDCQEKREELEKVTREELPG